jgi:hypothetical protein
MVRSLLIRGMLVGILAGLLAFGFAKLFGEPQVDAAIAFEENHSHEAGAVPAANSMSNMSMAPAATTPAEAPDANAHDHGDEELVSRPMQASFGLLTGVLTYGTALGGIFALVFAFAQGRIGTVSPRATAAVVAVAGFVAVVIVPQIKYPANPPAIGNPATIGSRTELYFIMVAVSILAMIAAFSTAGSLATRFGRWNGTLVAAAAYVVVITLAMLVLPSVNEVPSDFSADVLWKFRMASLGIHTVLWTTLGIAFGMAAERLMPSATKTRIANAY